MNTRAERFPLFDSLRAIAALSVLAFHAAFFSGAFTSDSPVRQYVSHLDVGVSVFFLISGFLLYRPFAAARLGGGGGGPPRGDARPGGPRPGETAPRGGGPSRPHAGAYAWRRFLRIVPAYWVALTVVALWLSLDGVFTASGIPTYYGFAQIYSAEHSLGGIAQAWTLCVEVTFYAFLPLWAFAMRRLPGGVRTELIALAFLWLFSLAWKLYALRRVDPSSLDAGPWVMPLPNFLDQFALGMALAVLSVANRDAFGWAARRPWLCWLGAAVAFWLVSTQAGIEGRLGEQLSDAEFLARHELYSLVALGVLLPAAFGWQRRDAVRRVLGWRPLLYVGLVSYGVYLWHYAIVKELAEGVNDWLVDTLGLGLELRLLVYFAAGAALSVAVASASYYLVERPALSLKRLVGPPPEREGAAGEAVTEPAPASPR